MVACCLRLLFLRRHDAVVALTTPPLISFVGAWARLRRARFFYWVMDFNPDEPLPPVGCVPIPWPPGS